MQVIYLVQGSQSTLARQQFGGAPFYSLCYDGVFECEGASGCLTSRTASWAVGRNMLLEAALIGHPDADYYVFCDDDVEFLKGDFAAFERALATTRPAIGFPLMPKARLGALLDESLPVQRALDVDEQMYAVHRSLIGTPGVAPLDSRHDHVSWYVASLTFEYLVGTRYLGMAHQFNTIELCNNGHVWETGETLYATNRGVPAYFIPVFAKHIEAAYGPYDDTVIEQFMPPLEPESYRSYVSGRRASSSVLSCFNGSEIRPAAAS